MAVYLDPITFPDAWNTCIFGRNLKTPGKCKVGKFDRKNEYDHKKGKGTKGEAQTLKGQPPAEGTITFWAWIPAHFAAWAPILEALRLDPTKGVNGSAAASKPATGAAPGSQFSGGTPDAPGSSTGSGQPAGSIPSPDNTSGTTSGASTSTSSSSNDAVALSAAFAIDIFHPALADIDVHQVLPPEELGSWEEDGEGSGLYKREIKFVEFSQAPNASIAATPTGATDGAADPTQQFATGGGDTSAPSAAAASANRAAQGAQGASGA